MKFNIPRCSTCRNWNVRQLERAIASSTKNALAESIAQLVLTMVRGSMAAEAEGSDIGPFPNWSRARGLAVDGLAHEVERGF
jgi:hypothetical protein